MTNSAAHPSGNNAPHNAVLALTQILPAEAKAGKPYYMDVIPGTVAAPQEEEAVAKPAKGTMLYYRVPAVCNVTLGVGTTPLLRMRVPVYQMGEEQVNFVK